MILGKSLKNIKNINVVGGDINLNPQKTRYELRYEKILNSALELFLENGFENTSLNDIVAKSGGSLATIYKLFDNKDKLFDIALNEAISKFFDENVIKIDQNLPLERFLLDFGFRYCKNYIFSKEQLLITRIMISNGYNKQSDLRNKHYKCFIQKPVEILVEYFSQPHIKEKFKAENLTELSHRFCSIFQNYIFLQNVLSVKVTAFSMSEARIKKIVKQGVDIFLNGEIKHLN